MLLTPFFIVGKVFIEELPHLERIDVRKPSVQNPYHLFKQEQESRVDLPPIDPYTLMVSPSEMPTTLPSKEPA